jgi:hypothetical protein
MSAGIDKPKPFQMNEIVTQGTISHGRIDLRADISKLAFSSSSNGLKNLALAVRKVMSDAKRRHVPARQKPNTHRSANLQELRLWMTCTQTQFNNSLCTTSPSFNQSSPIEDLCDQWVSRSRQMFSLQVLNFHAEGKRTGTPYLKAIIVNSQAHCTA